MAVRRVPVLLSRRVVARGARSLSSIASKTPARGLATAKAPSSLFASLDTFSNRHIGPEDSEIQHMLKQLGYDSIEAFVADTVPPQIRVASNDISNDSIPALSESELFNRARELAKANKPVKSYIGMGYHNAVVPPVILRNVRLLAFSARRHVDSVHIRSWRVPPGILPTPHISRRLPKVRVMWRVLICGENLTRAFRTSRVSGQFPEHDHVHDCHGHRERVFA